MWPLNFRWICSLLHDCLDQWGADHRFLKASGCEIVEGLSPRVGFSLVVGVLKPSEPGKDKKPLSSFTSRCVPRNRNERRKGKVRWIHGTPHLTLEPYSREAAFKWHPKFRDLREWEYLIEINEKSLCNVNYFLPLWSHNLDQENVKNTDMKEPQAIVSLFPASVYKWKRHKWWPLVHKFVYSVSLMDLKFKQERFVSPSAGLAVLCRENTKRFRWTMGMCRRNTLVVSVYRCLVSVQLLFNGTDLCLQLVSVLCPPLALRLGTLIHSSALDPALWD